MKKYFLFILIGLFILSINNSYAGNSNAGAFLDAGVGARALSLGKTGVANKTEASSVYWNPALLANLSGMNIDLMVGQPFSAVDDLQYHSLFFAKGNAKTGWGIGLIYSGADNIREATSSGVLTGRTFDSIESALMFGFSKELWKENITWGITGKTVYQKIDNKSALGIGLDAGLSYNVNDYLLTGLTIKNLIPPIMKLDKDRDVYPLRIDLGFQIKALQNLDLFYDLSYEDKETSHHAGIEYSAFDMLFLRIGYDEETEQIGGGIGVNINKFALDYSYNNHEFLNASHRISLKFNF